MKHSLNFFTTVGSKLLFLLALFYSHAILSSCHEEDWVPTNDPHNLCHGYYLQKPLLLPGFDKSLLKRQPLSVTSDHAHFHLEGSSTLTGHVHLIQGNTQLFADEAIIHRDPKKPIPIDWVKAKGHIKLYEPGIRLEGTQAEVLTQSDTKIIQHAHYRLYDRHARGYAERITVHQQNEMILKEATYTTCAPCQNTWNLKIKSANLNKKTGRGQAKQTSLYVHHFPIFYFPYLDFPIDNRRQTGFLFPQFGFTNRSGLELGTPFYWNLAPNYDATLTPRFLSKRGLELQGKFRYLSSQSSGEIEGTVLPDDRNYRQFRINQLANHPEIPALDPRITALQTNDHRHAVRIKHDTHFNEHWLANVHYQTVSDDNYFMDFGNNIGIAGTTQLLQQGQLIYQGTNWNIRTRLQQYQTLHPFTGPLTSDAYKRLPQITVTSYSDLPYGLHFSHTGEFSHFAHKKDPLTGNAFTTGNRLQLRPGISLPFTTPGWYLKPRIQWNILLYSLTLGPKDISYLQAHSAQSTPIYDLDSGLIFERSFMIKKESYIQTLEPRVYYLYVPFRNQNALPLFDTQYLGFDYNHLYWENRFTGLDRLGDTNQLTLGLTSRFLDAVAGNERLNFTLGQIFYFQKRQVSACAKSDVDCFNQQLSDQLRGRSNLTAQVRYSFPTFWTAHANLEWDPYQKKLAKQGFHFQYHPDTSSVFNMGYQFLRHNPAKNESTPGAAARLSQSDVSFAWPLTFQWRILGRWQYDLYQHRSNEIAAGIEQHGCCTAVRLFFSHFLQPYDNTSLNNHRQYSNAIFLQFIFKGLAGIGHHHLDSTLHRTISGYRWQPQNF